jgi:MYXO-CTERM domain-containing protein
VPRSVLGDPAVGAVISGFDARTRVGAQSATSRDTAGPSDYTVRGIDICLNAGVITAALQASTHEGEVPLPVTFTLSGTVAEGKTLASYSLDFGDGSAVKTGTFSGGSAQAAHTYAAVGVYRAKLTVTDSDGTSSANLAEQTITVLSQGTLGGTGAVGNNKIGGAFPLLSLAVLGLLGGLRRRRAIRR